jgi:hypothetical protein
MLQDRPTVTVRARVEVRKLDPAGNLVETVTSEEDVEMPASEYERLRAQAEGD